MPILVSFKEYSHIHLTSERVARLIRGGKKEAMYLGPLDRTKEIFRKTKKRGMLLALHEFLHQLQQKDKFTDLDLNHNPYSKMAALVNSFNRFVELLPPDNQPLCKIKHDINANSSEFIINNEMLCVVHNLTTDYLLCCEERLNCDEYIRKALSSSINKDYNTTIESKKNNNNQQLFADICRASYYIDGNRMLIDDQLTCCQKKKNTENFLKKLTPEQRIAVDILCTQTLSAHIIELLDENSETHILFTGKNQHWNIETDNTDGSIKVEFLITQDLTDNLFTERCKMKTENQYYHEKKYKVSLKKHNASFPRLHIRAAFSIDKAGQTSCQDFNVNDTLTCLSQKNPSEILPLTYFNKMIIETNNAWQNLGEEGQKEFSFDQSNFYHVQLNKYLQIYSDEEKKKMLENLEEKSGKRWRDIMNFVAQQVKKNVTNNNKLVVTVEKHALMWNVLLSMLREMHGEEKKAEGKAGKASLMKDMNELQASENIILSRIGIESSMLASPVKKLKIINYTQYL
ncbi:hypothetical protein SK355_12530 [Candidatus Fukatsuia symbiotica]|uniref:Uncharacterized protein n=2 Tax=Candidatus Fukatsuia TaxID=1927833 RepID=A0A2U8I3T8_9GAMM|nr:hypothetical protein [Candidatus Fukatsuia symbiotica]AWK13800.1 hypothetical protein CCS41_03830 [Candidatus Fukatsuia symbiotica]MEA9445995.1 hypothetical protein [Candidatus Fukatsuia symbiotica]